MFRGADYAYANMDYTGIGSIYEEDFLNCSIIPRLPFPREELKEFLKVSQLFANGMNFDNFKKVFFPHLYTVVDDDCCSDDEKKERDDKIQMK